MERSIIIDFGSFTQTGILRFENLLTLVHRLIEIDDLVSFGFFEFLLFVFLIDAVASDKGDYKDKSENHGKDDGKDSLILRKTIIIFLDSLILVSIVILMIVEFLFGDDFSSLGIFRDFNFILDAEDGRITFDLSALILEFFSEFLKFFISDERILGSDRLIIVNHQGDVRFSR